MNSVKNHLDQVILELSKVIPLEFIKENLFIAVDQLEAWFLEKNLKTTIFS